MKRKVEVARTYTADTAAQAAIHKVMMKVVRVYVPARASSDRVDARAAGVVLVHTRCFGAVAKARALGYQQMAHDAVDFIAAAVSLQMMMRARTFLVVVLVSPVGESDFFNAARLDAVFVVWNHKSDPQQFEKQGGPRTNDAAMYEPRCFKTAKLIHVQSFEGRLMRM